MNRFDYPTTLAIIGALFVVMSMVSIVHGRDLKRRIGANVVVAALLAFAASVVFAAAGVMR